MTSRPLDLHPANDAAARAAAKEALYAAAGELDPHWTQQFALVDLEGRLIEIFGRYQQSIREENTRLRDQVARLMEFQPVTMVIEHPQTG